MIEFKVIAPFFIPIALGVFYFSVSAMIAAPSEEEEKEKREKEIDLFLKIWQKKLQRTLKND